MLFAKAASSELFVSTSGGIVRHDVRANLSWDRMTFLEKDNSDTVPTVSPGDLGRPIAKRRVHCWRGADRTGAVIAAYRIDHDHWDNDRALKDAKAHGMGFFQIPRQNFIKDFRPAAMKAQKAAEGNASAKIPVMVRSPAPGN